MARIGIQITKSTSFRLATQEFHNIYYYQDPIAVTTPAENLLDEVIALERAWHSTAVNFVRGSVWTAGGTPTQNQMLFQKALTGQGAAPSDATMDKERAYLIQWPAGFDIRGLPVRLKKWYHTGGNFGSVAAAGATQMAQTAEIASANRTSINNLVNALNEIGVGEAWDLCSRTGRQWEGQPVCHRFLEHHQLGDAWR